MNQYEVASEKTIEKQTEEKIKETSKSVKQDQPKVTLKNGTQITNWQNVLDDLKKQGKVMLYANLINTEAVEVSDMTVEIRFHNGLNSFRKELLQKPENMSILTKEISIMCGKDMHIKLQDASNTVKESAKKTNNELETKLQTKPVEETPKQIEKISDLDSLDIPINFIEE